MTNLKSKSFLITCALCLLIVICFFKNHSRENEKQYFTHELEWDVFSYYMYLPFTFIYHDVGMKDRSVVENIFKKYELPGTYYQAYQLENGNYTPNYTMGFALLWSPFFFIGHFWAKSAGYPVDGWSFPYQFSISLGVLFYILAGLFFLRKVLLHFFSEKITSLVLLLLVLGTNYFHETFNDFMQPHAQVFTGYCILLYYTIRWHEQQKKRYMIIAGLVIGLMILSRPSEILCVLIPLLWNVYDKDSLAKKIALVRANFSQCLLLICFAFIPFIPQIIYWKAVTGSWIFFSYQNTEGFDFLQPHIFKVLFSFKKSWFVYTPIIIFPIIGILLLKKYNRNIFLPVLIFFLANFYLLSSWAAWWNGGSFGMRYFVDSYPVLAISFGYFLIDIERRNVLLKTFCAIALILFTFLNLFQTWQYVHGIIPEDRMTRAYYKSIFLKTKVTDDQRKLMEVERSHESSETFKNVDEYNHHTIGLFDFDSANSGSTDESKYDTTYHLSGIHSYRMNENDEWGPKFQVQYDQLVPGDRDHAWIKVTVNYFTEEDIKDNPASLVINMPHRKYNLKYRSFDFEKAPSKKGEWNRLEFDYMTPYPYSGSDHFDIYIWHRGKKPIWFDDFKIEAYLKK
jgi:hypothetical protein